MPLSHRAFTKIGVVTLLAISSLALAQALTISPARYDITADKGTTVEGDFLLINEQNDAATFYTSVQNFEAQGETGTPNFTDSKDGLASWVHVVDSVHLDKGEKKKIHFTISVPNDADAGGHFAAIFLSTVPPATSGQTGVSVGAKIGMLVLLRVNGEIKEGGGIASFGTKDGSHFITSLPVTFMYRFTNSGNDRVNPTGDIVIRDTIGLKADTINANEMAGNILPSSTRRFDVTWGNEKDLNSDATFMDHVGYELSHFAFGFYTAKINLSFGSSSTSSASTWFVVLPWHLLVVVALVCLVIWYLIKRYNRWIIKQAQLHSRA